MVRGGIGPRLTYANVMSTLALFIALGGVSYAAVKLKANSVKSKHIAPNAVKGVHVKKSALGKVPSAARADDADRLGGIDPSQFARFERTVVVGSGETPAAGGAALAAALAAIEDAGAGNPVLLWVEPGSYSLGETVSVPSFVRVEGAGRGMTMLAGSGELVLESHSQLAELSSTGAVATQGEAEEILIERVDLDALTLAEANGVTLREVRAPATLDETLNALVLDSDLSDAVISGVDGVHFADSDLLRVQIQNSTGVAAEQAIVSEAQITDSNATFANSRFTSDNVVEDSGVICLRSYDENFADLGPNCTLPEP